MEEVTFFKISDDDDDECYNESPTHKKYWDLHLSMPCYKDLHSCSKGANYKEVVLYFS